jgi:hypothetical protein
MKNKNKNLLPATKRTGKFLLKLFFALLLLKIFALACRISNSCTFPSIDTQLNIALALTLSVGLLLYLPYYKALVFIKRFFKNFNVNKMEEEHAKIVLSYTFEFTLIAYLLLLAVSEFKKLNFSLNYLLLAVVVFGIFCIIFPVRHQKCSLPCLCQKCGYVKN